MANFLNLGNEKFLWAKGIDDKVISYLKTCFNNKEQISSAVHQSMLKYFKEYLCVGGMPSVVDIFLKTNVGIGIANLILVQYRTTKPGIIFELKVDSSPIDAIKQIKQKNYLESFNTYKGKILLIGINLDSKTKKHTVLIEEVNK